MSDYRELDWEMFTGHMFSRKELDEIYERGRADERARVVEELSSKIICHLSDYALQEAPIFQGESSIVYDTIVKCIDGVKEVAEQLKSAK